MNTFIKVMGSFIGLVPPHVHPSGCQGTQPVQRTSGPRPPIMLLIGPTVPSCTNVLVPIPHHPFGPTHNSRHPCRRSTPFRGHVPPEQHPQKFSNFWGHCYRWFPASAVHARGPSITITPSRSHGDVTQPVCPLVPTASVFPGSATS